MWTFRFYFFGFVYAPGSETERMRNGEVRGLCWVRTLPGELWIRTSGSNVGHVCVSVLGEYFELQMWVYRILTCLVDVYGLLDEMRLFLVIFTAKLGSSSRLGWLTIRLNMHEDDLSDSATKEACGVTYFSHCVAMWGTTRVTPNPLFYIK